MIQPLKMITREKSRVGGYDITTLVSDERWCENCYLVRHAASSEQILIDPGGNADGIIQAVVDQGENLKMILITHAHHDHVMALSAVHQRFSVPCYVQKEDVKLMRQAPMYAMVFASQQIPAFIDFQAMTDQDVLRTKSQMIQVIHSPGHTLGSVCYGFGGFVFTGDTLFYKHMGRSDTPGASAEQLKDSISRLTATLSGETVLFPGHGRAWTAGEAKRWWEHAIAAPPVYQRFGEI
jgi:glyoxylase-like metal-dependent hydrolase (beta-lactamase superfamily II)